MSVSLVFVPSPAVVSGGPSQGTYNSGNSQEKLYMAGPRHTFGYRILTAHCLFSCGGDL